jgi:hypothetical protein
MTIRTTSQWREVIKQQQNSELDVKAYCQQHSINIKTFYNRRAKLGFGQKPAASSFVQAKPMSISQPQGLLLSMSGATLSIPQNADPTWLGQLLRALTT